MLKRVIEKMEFVRLMESLQETEDLQRDIDELFRNSSLDLVRDFAYSEAIMICHTDKVAYVLEKMFDTDMITYWIYELNFGRNYKDGMIIDKDGNVIDIGTAEKLYDYLIEDLETEEK